MNDAVSAALPFAFGSFTIWLTIHFINRSEKRKKAIQAVVALVIILLAYPLSFGPVFWIRARIGQPPNVGVINDALQAIYWPLGELSAIGPKAIKNALTWYVKLGATEEFEVPIPISNGNWLYVDRR